MSLQSHFHPRIINEIDGFSLVGTGDSHYWCGIWQTYGCLNHKQAYIRQFKKTCFRSECKVCYIAWARRQANRTITKLNRMKKNNTLHHAIVTIPTTWNKQTKQSFITSLKKIGIESACIIHTPFDESNNQKFYLKNTLHIFYYGKLRYSDALQVYHQDDLDGTNQKLFKVLQTQFLNCGVKKGTHPITWVGRTIYCTLEPENNTIDGRNCPLCNKKLHLIYWNGDFPPIPPDESFSGELDKDGWKYCFRESIWRKLFRKIKRKVNSIFLSKCIDYISRLGSI